MLLRSLLLDSKDVPHPPPQSLLEGLGSPAQEQEELTHEATLTGEGQRGGQQINTFCSGLQTFCSARPETARTAQQLLLLCAEQPAC